MHGISVGERLCSMLARERSLSALRLLLRRGARLDEEAYGRCGSLYWASAIYRYDDRRHRYASRDKDELLRFLIQSGLDINHRRRNGRSLLFDVCDDAGINLLMALCRHNGFEDIFIVSEFLFEPKPPERDWVDGMSECSF